MGGTEIGTTWTIPSPVDPTLPVVTVEWPVFHDTAPEVGDRVLFGPEGTVGTVALVDHVPRLVVTVSLPAAVAKAPTAEPVHEPGPKPPVVLDVGDVDTRTLAAHLLGPAMDGETVWVEFGDGSVRGVVTEVLVDGNIGSVLMVVVRTTDDDPRDVRIPWRRVQGINTPTWDPRP